MTQENEQPNKPAHDQIGRISFGLIVIWLGISFLLKTHDVIYSSDWWAYFIIGLGVILIAECGLRMLRGTQISVLTGKLIGGAVLIGIGLAALYDIEDWWPLIIVAAGVVVLIQGLRKTRDS